jgi:bifunctional DNA-binding transcriptional regulator/antitoxin component of YhaV-PrlF toxin-antitoxin module
MSENNDDSNKPSVELKKEYLRHCREYEMRPYKGNSPDNLAGTLPLRDNDLQAADAKRGDNVILYVEAEKGNSVTERPTQSQGRGITLPVKERRKLGLGADDTIEYWIQNPETYKAKAGHEWKEHVQSTLEKSTIKESSDQGAADDKDDVYVLMNGADSTRYHRVTSKDESKTACGIDYESHEYAIIEDPRSLLKECENCTSKSESDMTNAELVEWIGDRVGFTNSSSTSGYFEKSNLEKIKEYIENSEYQTT